MTLVRGGAKLVFAVTDLALQAPVGPRILIYHQVGVGIGHQMGVTEADFEWQLDWLAQNREVVDLSTALQRWDEPDSDRLVVLTFDDGYLDTFTTAFPQMVARDFPFTLYLATEMVETGLDVNGTSPLTWHQIRTMMESGLVTIGAHTHSHVDLRTVDVDAAEHELQTSDDLIERRLGVAPHHFAYPWGYWAPEVDALVRSRYETATLGAPMRRTEFDHHEIHRFPVQLSDGTRWFPSRLRGGLLAEERVRRRLRGYRGP